MIRPILFSGDMVRAILAGAKTQTRRVVKPQPEMEMDGEICPDGSGGWDWIPVWPEGHRLAGRVLGYGQCPFGQPGDLLWVRETWAIPDSEPLRGRVLPREYVAYAASCPLVDIESPSIRWRPSIHMPRWACRLVLEVVSVRVERLQEITEEGALMEGSFLGRCPCSEMRRKPRVPIEAAFRQTGCYIHGIEFKTLWDSIYSAKGRGWDANPWVWAVEFKVAAKTLNEAQAILGAA